MAAVVNLRYALDRGLLDVQTPERSQWVDARVLAQNVNETHTVPTGATVVVITATIALWVNLNGTTAASPAADVTDGTASIFVPANLPFRRLIDGVASFGLITGDAAGSKVTLEFYK